MESSEREAINAKIKTLLEADQNDEAAELALKCYGPGLMGFFMGVFHDEDTAQEVFQHFSIELWRALPSFEGRSAFFSWAYTLARRSVTWQLRRPERREQRLHTQQELAIQERWRRTATLEWRKTTQKLRFRELCKDLDPEERTLVMLRIGEKMSWTEIAHITHEGDETLDGHAAKRKAATLRKRFERIKDQLKRAMGRG